MGRERPANQSFRTHTGRQFWPLTPEPADVAAEDVAHALSLTCRWGGQCDEFYSVAQHSLMVADLLAAAYGPAVAWFGLVHDGSEAYLVDLPRPVKHAHLMRHFRDADERLQHVVYVALCGRAPTAHEAKLVKWADDLALAVEWRDLFAAHRAALPAPQHAQQDGVPRAVPLAVPAHAEQRWLRRYEQLRDNTMARLANDIASGVGGGQI